MDELSAHEPYSACVGGWRGSSVVKTIHCSCRGPKDWSPANHCIAMSAAPDPQGDGILCPNSWDKLFGLSDSSTPFKFSK